MATPSRESLDYNRTAAIVAGLASGAAFALGTGLEPWWPLAWLAPLPVLAAAYRVPKWPAAALALGVWVLGALPMGAFLYRSLRAPLLVVLVAVVIPAIVFAMVVVVSRALVRRGSPWAAAMAVPALWVSFELLVARGSPHGSAGSLAYSQAEVLPFVQLVSVTGLSGVTFLLMALPAAVAVSTYRSGRGRGSRRRARGVRRRCRPLPDDRREPGVTGHRRLRRGGRRAGGARGHHRRPARKVRRRDG